MSEPGPSTPPRSSNAFASTSRRPNSPSPSTSSFSLIGADEINDYGASFWSYNTSTPYKGFGSSSLGRRAIYSTPTLNYFGSSGSGSGIPFPSSSNTHTTGNTGLSGTGAALKSLFPRIWDVLISSPTRNINIISSTRGVDSSDTHRHSAPMFPRHSYSPQSPSPTTRINRLTKGKGRAATSKTHYHYYSDGNNDSEVDYSPVNLIRTFTSPISPVTPTTPITPTHNRHRHSLSSQYSYINVNYSDLAPYPLDGEEGELIDFDVDVVDEACFIPSAGYGHYGGSNWLGGGGKGSFSRARVVTGIDILGMLPTEVALSVLEFLAAGPGTSSYISRESSHSRNSNSTYRASGSRTTDFYHHLHREESYPYHQDQQIYDTLDQITPLLALENILTCSLVSKTWRQLAMDNSVWRVLFERRWGSSHSLAQSGINVNTTSGVGRGITMDPGVLGIYRDNIRASRRRAGGLRMTEMGRDKCLPALPTDDAAISPISGLGDDSPSSSTTKEEESEVQSSEELEVLCLNYFQLYQERLELDRRWAGTAFTKRVSSACSPPNSPYSSPIINSPLQLNLRSPPASRSSSLVPMYAGEESTTLAATTSAMSSSYALASPRSSLGASTILGIGPIQSQMQMEEVPPMQSEFVQEEHWDKWEPEVRKLSGHSDSVYCIDLPLSPTYALDTFFVTGSRDRTIKMWRLGTSLSSRSSPNGGGECIGTFGRSPWGAGSRPTSTSTSNVFGLGPNGSDDEVPKGHAGSVLCLKFIWDEGIYEEEEEFREYGVSMNTRGDKSKGKAREGEVLIRKGIMFSGSSDCMIFVWDVWVRIVVGEEGIRTCTARAQVRKVLRGHTGGVLDLRVDGEWIVSCSKDTTIRVWSRHTLLPHRTLRGHEGPVNAVGMDSSIYGFGSSKVVSASGDGKMILWDVASGERLRTFEGHDRGLACIEFSNNFIISGSNDWKIKIWSAFTGKCLKTLTGHENLVRALAFDAKRGVLVSASYDKSVRVWDLRDILEGGANRTQDGERERERDSKSLMRVFRNAHTSHIFDVKFDVGRIVSTSHDQKIVVVEFSEGLKNGNLFL